MMFFCQSDHWENHLGHELLSGSTTLKHRSQVLVLKNLYGFLTKKRVGAYLLGNH